MAATVKGTANSAAGTSVTIPSHAVGDLIQLFVYRDGATAIATKPAAAGTIPAWVDIDAPTGANTNACATYWFIATATNHTTGAWTGATGMTAVVITGHDPTTPIGGHAVGGSTGTNTAQAPAITLTKTDGTSLILGHYGHRTVTAWSTAPAGYTRQTSVATEVCLNTKDSSTSDGAISQTCTASSSGYRGATVEILAAVTPGPKLETLTADFNSGLGSDFTNISGTTGASGGLRIDHAATAYGVISTYPGANSTIAYDLTGSYGYVKAADLGNTALTSHDVVYGLSATTNNWLMFFTEATTLYASRMVAGSQTTVASATFNATNHRWWKIREASGTIFWDVSADGVTWNNFASLANPFAVTNLFVQFRCGIWQDEASASYCVFDNFNTAGATTLTPSGATISITGGTPKLDTALRPSPATVATTGGTPTVTVSTSTVLTPAAATVTVTGGAPRLGTTLQPAGATVTTSGGTPRLDTALRPAAATVAVTGSAPTLLTPQTLTPAAAGVSTTGGTPTVTVSSNTVLTPAGATVTTTGSAPKLDTAVRPAGATVTATGSSPALATAVTPGGATVASSGGTPQLGTAVTPVPATIVSAGGTPVVSTPTVVTPAPATVTATGGVPKLDTVVRPTGATIAATGAAPAIITPQTLRPAAAIITTTGGVPYLAQPGTYLPGSATISTTGGVPLVHAPILPAAATITATGSAPTVSVSDNKLITPIAATVTTTGGVPRLVTPQTVTPNGATVTTIGGTPTVTVSSTTVLAPAAATITATGGTPTVTATDHKTITPAGATIAATGGTPAIVTPVIITPAEATITTAESAPVVRIGIRITPAAATLTISAHTPQIGLGLQPAGATITVTLGTPGILLPNLIAPAAASITITGGVPGISNSDWEQWLAVAHRIKVLVATPTCVVRVNSPPTVPIRAGMPGVPVHVEPVTIPVTF